MITASIVTYNSDRQELRHALQCVADSLVETIYVVDNSKEDSLCKFVESISDRVKYIHGHGNIGYGSAHNIAMRQAQKQGSSYHVVINPDIYFDNGSLEALAFFMDSNPSIGQVMPKVVYPNGELQYLCKLLPTPMDLIARRFIPCKSYVEKNNAVFEMRQSNYNTELDVPFLSGCFMFLRVDAIEKTGGFDDDFFMYCEDIDFCRRIGMAGYRTVFYPSVTIVHAHKKDSYKSRAMLVAHAKSAIRYFNKWGWVFDSYRKRINKEARQQYK